MLSLVPTPIGNLADITLRALATLREADVIAAEDTRHSLILLRHHGIEPRELVSLHEHNEARRTQELTGRMREGAKVALITDAGLPGVSDPGARLIRACHEQGLPFTILPGPCAVPLAVVGSGFDLEDGWFFGGFLPPKSGGREREVRAALERVCTSVFYESPHRLTKTLDLLAEIAPDRAVCVARELTKHFEEYRRGPAAEVAAHYRNHPPKGEMAVVVAGAGRRAGREA